MPAHRLVPDPTTLRLWLQEGLTHQQIADRQFALTGKRVSRASVSAAVSRLGLSRPTPRYIDEIPWRVKEEHIRAYPARMLRLLGRHRRGLHLKQEEAARLDRWLRLLEDYGGTGAVVAYDPDDPDGEGFWYAARRQDELAGDIPIRPGISRVMGSGGQAWLSA